MEVIVKGKNVDLADDLTLYTERKIGKLTKLSTRVQSVKVTMTKNASKNPNKAFRVEAIVNAPGQTLKAEEDDGSFYSAVDAVLDKLRRQLKKLKTKLTDKPRGKPGRSTVLPYPVEPVIVEDLNIEPPEIIIQRFPAKPMSTAEAVMQLEVTGGNMLLFVNDNAVVNCLRKRPEGGYFLYLPEEEVK
ncbi:ribosome-associated translation inhibitor RaiA [bacterium]|nr:ribosome-associated translation inhibitor RaiA [bacterium]